MLVEMREIITKLDLKELRAQLFTKLGTGELQLLNGKMYFCFEIINWHVLDLVIGNSRIYTSKI